MELSRTAHDRPGQDPETEYVEDPSHPGRFWFRFGLMDAVQGGPGSGSPLEGQSVAQGVDYVPIGRGDPSSVEILVPGELKRRDPAPVQKKETLPVKKIIPSNKRDPLSAKERDLLPVKTGNPALLHNTNSLPRVKNQNPSLGLEQNLPHIPNRNPSTAQYRNPTFPQHRVPTSQHQKLVPRFPDVLQTVPAPNGGRRAVSGVIVGSGHQRRPVTGLGNIGTHRLPASLLASVPGPFQPPSPQGRPRGPAPGRGPPTRILTAPQRFSEENSGQGQPQNFDLTASALLNFGGRRPAAPGSPSNIIVGQPGHGGPDGFRGGRLFNQLNRNRPSFQSSPGSQVRQSVRVGEEVKPQLLRVKSLSQNSLNLHKPAPVGVVHGGIGKHRVIIPARDRHTQQVQKVTAATVNRLNTSQATPTKQILALSGHSGKLEPPASFQPSVPKPKISGPVVVQNGPGQSVQIGSHTSGSPDEQSGHQEPTPGQNPSEQSLHKPLLNVGVTEQAEQAKSASSHGKPVHVGHATPSSAGDKVAQLRPIQPANGQSVPNPSKQNIPSQTPHLTGQLIQGRPGPVGLNRPVQSSASQLRPFNIRPGQPELVEHLPQKKNAEHQKRPVVPVPFHVHHRTPVRGALGQIISRPSQSVQPGGLLAPQISPRRPLKTRPIQTPNQEHIGLRRPPFPARPGQSGQDRPVRTQNIPGQLVHRRPVHIPNIPGQLVPRRPVLFHNKPRQPGLTGPVPLLNNAGHPGLRRPTPIPQKPQRPGPKRPDLAQNRPPNLRPVTPIPSLVKNGVTDQRAPPTTQITTSSFDGELKPPSALKDTKQTTKHQHPQQEQLSKSSQNQSTSLSGPNSAIRPETQTPTIERNHNGQSASRRPAAVQNKPSVQSKPGQQIQPGPELIRNNSGPHRRPAVIQNGAPPLTLPPLPRSPDLCPPGPPIHPRPNRRRDGPLPPPPRQFSSARLRPPSGGPQTRPLALVRSNGLRPAPIPRRPGLVPSVRPNMGPDQFNRRPTLPGGGPPLPDGRPLQPNGRRPRPSGEPPRPFGGPSRPDKRPPRPDGRPSRPNAGPLQHNGGSPRSNGEPARPDERPVVQPGVISLPSGGRVPGGSPRRLIMDRHDGSSAFHQQYYHGNGGGRHPQEVEVQHGYKNVFAGYEAYHGYPYNVQGHNYGKDYTLGQGYGHGYRTIYTGDGHGHGQTGQGHGHGHSHVHGQGHDQGQGHGQGQGHVHGHGGSQSYPGIPHTHVSHSSDHDSSSHSQQRGSSSESKTEEAGDMKSSEESSSGSSSVADDSSDEKRPGPKQPLVSSGSYTAPAPHPVHVGDADHDGHGGHGGHGHGFGVHDDHGHGGSTSFSSPKAWYEQSVDRVGYAGLDDHHKSDQVIKKSPAVS